MRRLRRDCYTRSDMAIPARVFGLALLLLAAALRPGAALDPMDIPFDGPGLSASRILSELRADIASPAGRAAFPIGPARAVRPVVVAVSGLAMDDIGLCGVELRDIVKIWKELFPNQPPDVARISRALAALQDTLRDAGGDKPRPQDYLAESLREAAQKYRLDVEIVDFPWSRDPKDSDRAADEFTRRLLALRDGPATRGQPLYIVAHSWGGVLIHEALMRLERQGRPVVVERLVTLGAPLVPDKLWLRIFKKIGGGEAHLQSRVAKPRGVRRWVNFWADFDPVSNSVSAADENVRVDLPARPYEFRLQALLDTPARRAARKDLALLRSAGLWHFSYLDGFQAEFPALHESVFWNIPEMELPIALPVWPRR